MKISNSKKELARIISENGGWRSGDYASQHGGHGGIGFSLTKPERWGDTGWDAGGSFVSKIEYKKPIKNWHQTILSRDEYFHLYPEPDAKHEYCESVTRSIPDPESKPTIEQLAADYRSAKDYAGSKRQEADDAKADADARLAELVAAGKEFGLVLSVAAPEPDLVITDWRYLQVGDEIEARCHAGVLIGFITEMEPKDYDGERPFRFQPLGESTRWCTSSEFKFIRRP